VYFGTLTAKSKFRYLSENSATFGQRIPSAPELKKIRYLAAVPALKVAK